MEEILRSIRIDIPDESKPLTYRKAEELIHRQREVVEFALPPRQLFEFVVQSHNANQLYLLKHVPDMFDGDMVIFRVHCGNENDSSDLQSWATLRCRRHYRVLGRLRAL